MLNIKINLQHAIQLLTIVTITALSSACGGDDVASSDADPLNCQSPCLASAPVLDQSTLTASLGADITVTLTIAGGTDTIEICNGCSTITFEPMPSVTGGQGTLATTTTAVTATDATTLVFNITVPIGAVTGEFYPLINIRNTANLNSVEYTLDTANSSTDYSFEEYIEDPINGGAAGSSYTANGTYVGTVSTPFAIPVLTLN